MYPMRCTLLGVVLDDSQIHKISMLVYMSAEASGQDLLLPLLSLSSHTQSVFYVLLEWSWARL